ncbi:uncharacterized protein M6B38_142220 [Iris pallida]|uniref:DUF3054 domain-containing protein n=1 Tax=Iris pallida TaxID=29817 RepID=A0AAX6FB61_IRIPA|nr:uncharacterized protein M6B38_142220 [Iris pallida]
MLLLSQAPNGVLSSTTIFPTPSNPIKNPTLFSSSSSKSRRRFPSSSSQKPLPHLAFAASADRNATPVSSSAKEEEAKTGGSAGVSVVGEEGVPLEGVIQFDKPAGTTRSKLISWAQVGVLAGGDVLALLVFSAIGRFSHGFPVLDFETLRTADPFIAGWFLSAYFLRAYGDDAKGLNGTNRAIIVAVKSWAVGIPLGIIIRAVTSGHIPAIAFMLVTMGSTGVLLIGWRALACSLLSSKQDRNDVYKRGSPFELFELPVMYSPYRRLAIVSRSI